MSARAAGGRVAGARRAGLAAGLVAAALVSAGARVAHAEEGLFVARALGGIAAADGDAHAGGALLVSSDLALRERDGIIGEVSFTFHQGTRMGLGLGEKHVFFEDATRRVYGYLAPELFMVWPDDGPRRIDLAGRAGFGVEYLFMWGLGVVLEAGAVVPAGLGDARAGQGASTALSAGLYMEF
ncbi:MAG: hypothetical protein IT370_35520 [Deltaproteobacteria bacterium]|nr:hypothetical protein [Deltaproteobacteria bacterium]